MTTFSQLVDQITAETRRPDMRTEIAQYLNQTIRECHAYPQNNATLLFRENCIEAQLIADVEVGFGFTIPDPTSFQAMGAVKYESIITRNAVTQFVPERIPGRGMAGLHRYYYRAGGRYSFAGYGGLNAIIKIAYYQFPRPLKYYAAGLRPGEYDYDMGWTYADAFDSTPELQLAAQGFVTNWLLQRWDMVLAEGLRAKIYKRLSDTDRSRTCFSLYTQLRMGLATSEALSPGGFV